MDKWTYKTTKFHWPPEAVGYWVFPGSIDTWSYRISVYKKPKWFTIKMMKLLLDFGYEEITK